MLLFFYSVHCVFFWSHSPCTEWWLLLCVSNFNRFLIESSVFTPMIFCKYKCQTSPVVAISLCQSGKWKFKAIFPLAFTEHATTTQEWKLLEHIYWCQNFINFNEINDYLWKTLQGKTDEIMVAGLALWWEHLPSTNVARVWFPHSASYVDWVCWFSTLLWEVFPRVLRFSPLTKNQHLIWFDLIWSDL